jgi:hypothetical protein
LHKRVACKQGLPTEEALAFEWRMAELCALYSVCGIVCGTPDTGTGTKYKAPLSTLCLCLYQLPSARCSKSKGARRFTKRARCSAGLPPRGIGYTGCYRHGCAPVGSKRPDSR